MYVYIYMYIHIYIYIYTLNFNCFDIFEQMQEVFFHMIIYTENDTESHRNIKNTNLQHTPNAIIHFRKTNCIEHFLFRKLDIHSNQRFPLTFAGKLEMFV